MATVDPPAHETLVASLRRKIAAAEEQLEGLRQELAAVEAQASQPRPDNPPNGSPDGEGPGHPVQPDAAAAQPSRWPLSKEEYARYGRQLIMPQIGLYGQLLLKNASVLIVGVGGLGCPAAAYLAGAGVGTIGLLDGDTVDVSNLHRQILHATDRVGQTKVQSAIVYLKGLNPSVNYVAHETRVHPEICLDIFRNYDVVLDCTDNPASRYLISDACVILGKVLVSASALRTDGQLMVLNNPPRPPGHHEGGPCYRCVFPKPPHPAIVMSCGEGGVLGPVVGVMGVLQAMETIKVIVPYQDLQAGEGPSMLLYSSYNETPFYSYSLRRRKPNCQACGPQPTVVAASLTSGSLDYLQFCGSVNSVNALLPSERISVEEYKKIVDGAEPNDHFLIDVREQVQFDLCHLDNSINTPFSELAASFLPESNHTFIQSQSWMLESWSSQREKPIYVVCRFGNDSQLAVNMFKHLNLNLGGQRIIKDIVGGLHAWSQKVDPDFPDY